MKKNLLNIVLVIAIILACFSSIKIINAYKENTETNTVIKKIKNEVEITESYDSKNTIVINNNNIVKSDPYFDYIKMKLTNINFQELKKINNETVGWINLLGTTINYPFVQTTNNNFYLNHSFDKSPNKAGWIYMDYRNNIKMFDKNRIFYGHNRLNNTMFGDLKKTLDNEWYNSKSNHIVKISTEYENSLWQVFSVYKITVTNDYLKTKFNTENEYNLFLSKIINRSEIKFSTSITSSDKIITLSTCHNDKERLVLHAKLIKYELK